MIKLLPNKRIDKQYVTVYIESTLLGVFDGLCEQANVSRSSAIVQLIQQLVDDTKVSSEHAE